MHYSQREKYEIIRLVEGSDLGVIRTLKELKVNKTTFYMWYKSYSENGYDGLLEHSRTPRSDFPASCFSEHTGQMYSGASCDGKNFPQVIHLN